MATERQAPDALLVQDNLSGALTDIDEDPDSPDGLWLAAISNNANSVCVVSFPTPTGNPTVGAGLQEFKWWARLTPNGTACDYDIYLRENGTRRNGGLPIASGSLTSTSGQLLSATWNASLLGTPDGSLVEAELVVTKSGGAPASRTTGEVGAVEWNVVYDVGQIYNEEITLTHLAGDSRGDLLSAVESISLPASAADFLEVKIDFPESLNLGAAAALGMLDEISKEEALTLAASVGIAPTAQANFVSLVALTVSAGIALDASLEMFDAITLNANAADARGGGLEFLEALVLDAIAGIAPAEVKEINESTTLAAFAALAMAAAKESDASLILSMIAGMSYIAPAKTYLSAVMFDAATRNRIFEAIKKKKFDAEP
jgi:hypothetical protein